MALALGARAQDTGSQTDRADAGAGGAAPAQAPAEPRISGADLADACFDLLEGEEPAGDVEDVRSQCAALLRRGLEAQGGVGRSSVPEGEGVRSALGQARDELLGREDRPVGMGMTSRGPVRNTLLTNPLGWFSGLGVNAEFSRPFPFEKLSWIAAARFSRTNVSNGDVSTFGLGAGADFFLLGRNNEGLRIGPRLDAAFGTESIQGTTTFGRLGASGEIGYNFIAASGLSASIAGGIGGRLAGDRQNEDFSSFTGGELGPYLKLGAGYSW
jgi:hypothetical protein